MLEESKQKSSLIRPDSMLLPLQKIMRDAQKTHAIPVYTEISHEGLTNPATIAAFDTYFGRMAVMSGTRKYKNSDIYFAQVFLRPDEIDLPSEQPLRIPTLAFSVAQAFNYRDDRCSAYDVLPADVRGLSLTEIMDAVTGKKAVVEGKLRFDQKGLRRPPEISEQFVLDLIFRLCGRRSNILAIKQSVADLADHYAAVPVSLYDLGSAHFVGQEIPVLPFRYEQNGELAISA